MTEAARRTAMRAGPARPQPVPATRPLRTLARTQPRATDEATATLSLSGDQLGAIVGLFGERLEALVRQLVAAELEELADPSSSGPEEWLTVEQISTQLQVSRRSVYRALRDGRLSAVKVGAQWRVRREELADWARPASADGRPAQLAASPPAHRSRPTPAHTDTASFGARVRERARRSERRPAPSRLDRPPPSNGGT
jgi:excisionase family DNA binding protein